MKKEKRIGIAFLSILALLLCVALGYELIDKKVKLTNANSVSNGKWCVKLTDLSKPILSEHAGSSDYSIKGTAFSFNSKLTSSRDSISYTLKIKNCGSVDAYLYSIDFDGYDDKDAYFTLVEGVEVGDTIKKGETVPVKVKISSKDDEIKDNKLKINFNFTQVD